MLATDTEVLYQITTGFEKYCRVLAEAVKEN